MDRSNVCSLITETRTQDQYGVEQVQQTEREVYCNVTSVTQREWFEGGRIGLNPEYRMTMFAYDYADEKLLKYNDIIYTIYRTYFTDNDEVELYVQRREGNG